jgi:hypothetical protein
MENLLTPPFGRILAAYQAEAIRLEFPIYLCVGKYGKENAYDYKKTGALATFLPYGDDYKKYKWPIENQKVIVMDTGFSSAISIKKMCHHLLSLFKPRVIFLYSDSIPNELFLPHGAAYNE